jgi:hypothetical protein
MPANFLTLPAHSISTEIEKHDGVPANCLKRFLFLFFVGSKLIKFDKSVLLPGRLAPAAGVLLLLDFCRNFLPVDLPEDSGGPGEVAS